MELADRFVIAIDGPAAAGKSTVSRMIASEYGYDYLDTGSMYRAIAFTCIQNQIEPTDEKLIVDILQNISIHFHRSGVNNEIFVNNLSVSSKIRTPEISEFASRISAFKEVRSFLFRLQREVISSGRHILEGRDTTTVVAPDADLKVFLTADIEERVKRRKQEMHNQGIMISWDEMYQNIKTRDERDTNRKESPLTRHPDALYIDSTNLTLDKVIKKIIVLTERD